ncbi:WS/DGAT domain-containing protein [Nocardia sp. NBC_00881]|uniref:wax ester/triacylglycerol synthase domain-containing protein n=1 Tax=Nocardia sp. NBC_00881 TaxID=2975995 RepID=UPI00386833F4|nr:WS/DGAT domain-containing protein [Nocardia sp. NBC_00881]
MPAEMELSSLDSHHLRLDVPAHPMNWVLVLELSSDGEPVRIDDVRARIAHRVNESDLYRLVLPTRPRRKPHFTIATSIDPTEHAKEHHVADRFGMLRQVEELMGSPMRRDAPPWDFTLVHQQDTKAQTLLLRVHHALSDGLAAAGFVAMLIDTVSGSTAEYQRFVSTPRFKVGPVDAVAALAAGTRSSRLVRRKGRRRGHVRPVGDRAVRRVAEIAVPTETVRQNRLKLGASTQEYVYAVAGLAFARAFPEHADRPLRIMFPVSLDHTLAHTGNAASLAILELPDAADSLSKRVHDVQAALHRSDPLRQAMDAPKTSHGLSYLPWRAQVLMTQLIAADSWDLAVGVNPAFSPDDRLLGREITNVVGFHPMLGRELAVTALILRDQVTIGMMADPAALPDVGLFAKHLRELMVGQV